METSKVVMGTTCARCGAASPPGSRFCGACGLPVAPPRPVTGASPAPAVVAAPAGRPAPGQPGRLARISAEGAATWQRLDTGRRVRVGGVGAVVVLFVCVIIYAAFINPLDASPDQVGQQPHDPCCAIPRSGEIVFGTAIERGPGTFEAIGLATSFRQGTRIFLSAQLNQKPGVRQVEFVDYAVDGWGREREQSRSTFYLDVQTVTLLSESFATGSFPLGRHRVRYLRDTTVLAEGTYTLR